MDRDSDDEIDKQWASKYIFGPLYDPEPSQVFATRVKAVPRTPPDSDSPARPSFRSQRNSRLRSKSQLDDDDEDLEDQPFIRRLLSRSNSVNKSLPPPPQRYKPPPLSPLERKRSVHTARPPQTRWNQGTILARSNSVATSRPSVDVDAMTVSRNVNRHRTGSLAERHPGDRSHQPLDTITQEYKPRELKEETMFPQDTLPRRNGSLRERYPGDLSHRPLAVLGREHRTADQAPYLQKHRQQPSDIIDCLDHSGPMPDTVYHHDGPFDPAMRSRNLNKRYSPIEAVKDTNMEAIKATPSVFVKDSLDKHVPLQGTAIVPPGMHDVCGHTMEYQEGADLVREYREGTDLTRENEAGGGPCKRWDRIPSFSPDSKRKGKQPHLPNNGLLFEGYYSTVTSGSGKDNNGHARQRSASNTAASPRATGQPHLNPFSDQRAAAGGLQRSNTTGKSLTQMLKRGLGSFRRKKAPEERAC